ncbi:MAG TPA: biotin/lipoyl-containing protein [Bryobacteraceae bacterium]|nr:biotin/lipoyl-containing protein [Bryobacteraceae bacterium]
MKRSARVAGREIEIETQSATDFQEVQPGIYSILQDGRSYEAQIVPDGDNWLVCLAGRTYEVEIYDPRDSRRGSGAKHREGRQSIKAPMPGKVIRTLVSQGDMVEAGQGIAVVEAMKMQNEMKSPKAGRVVELKAAAGDTVSAGSVLAVVE